MPRPRTTSDQAILAAAGRVIGRRGLPGLTLAAVAAEAGLSPATLVQRFGSKRGLLLALAAGAPAAARVPFERARRAHRSPLAALLAAVSGFATVASREELANHLTFLHLDLTDPQFHAYAAAHATAMREEIGRLLSAAAEAGELAVPAGVDLARALEAAYHGSLIAWALTGRGGLAETVRTNVETLLAPYRKENGT